MAERGFFRRPQYPEQNNPLGRDGLRLGITTHDRPSTPTRETPPPLVQDQVIKEALVQALKEYPRRTAENPKRTGRNRILIKAGSFAAAGLAIAGAWGVKHYAFGDNPSSTNSQTRSIDSFGPTSFNTETLKPTERFDNKARSGEVGRTKRIPQEETARLDSFAKIDDHNTVLAIFPIDISTSNKPDAKIKYIKRGGGSGNDQDRINRAEQGYLNIFYFENVPTGSTIFAPVDGHLIVFMNHNPKKDTTNEHPFSQAIITLQPREGKEFRMGIGGRSTEGGMMNKRTDVFRSLTNAPVYDTNMSPAERSGVLKQAIPIKKGDPILRAAMDIDVSFSMGGNIDLSKVKGTTTVNGKEVNLLQEDPVNLELFLEDGVIVQPRPTN